MRLRQPSQRRRHRLLAHTYLQISSSISTSLMAFHRQLAGIHDLFFSNVLVASVDEIPKREEALIRLASVIAEHRGLEPARRSVKAKPRHP